MINVYSMGKIFLVKATGEGEHSGRIGTINEHLDDSLSVDFGERFEGGEKRYANFPVDGDGNVADLEIEQKTRSAVLEVIS